MLKNINIRDIPEELYYDTVELKAKLEAKTWVDFLKYVLDMWQKVVDFEED